MCDCDSGGGRPASGIVFGPLEVRSDHPIKRTRAGGVPTPRELRPGKGKGRGLPRGPPQLGNAPSALVTFEGLAGRCDPNMAAMCPTLRGGHGSAGCHGSAVPNRFKPRSGGPNGGSWRSRLRVSRVLNEEIFRAFYMDVLNNSQKSLGPLDGGRRRFGSLIGSHPARWSPRPPPTARGGA